MYAWDETEVCRSTRSVDAPHSRSSKSRTLRLRSCCSSQAGVRGPVEEALASTPKEAPGVTSSRPADEAAAAFTFGRLRGLAALSRVPHGGASPHALRQGSGSGVMGPIAEFPVDEHRSLRPVPHRFEDHGARVLVLGRLVGASRLGEGDLDLRASWVWTVRAGRVVAMRAFLGERAARAAIGHGRGGGASLPRASD
jgi:hypothetical protein